MAQSAEFWNKVAEKYARRPIADETAYQQKLRSTQDHFRHDMRILEFGCGTGGYDAVLGLSVLHLLEDWPGAIGKVYRLLKPGGFFASSTACLRDMNPLIRVILPLMKLVGQAPPVQVFTAGGLKAAINGAGFVIKHEWRPKKNAALFIIATKPVENER